MSELLKDFVDIEQFAAEVERDERTVRRWMKQPDGLPHTRLGYRTLIHIPSAHQWLVDSVQHPNPRRQTKEVA